MASHCFNFRVKYNHHARVVAMGECQGGLAFMMGAGSRESVILLNEAYQNYD